MTFLQESSDAPRALAAGRYQTLPRPNPGECEYRLYFDHYIETIETQDGTIEVPVASFISVLSSEEPTPADWREVLREIGYEPEKIEEILRND